VTAAIEQMNKNNLPYSTPEEALNHARTKIAANSSSIIYILDISMTTDKTYDVIKLRPNNAIRTKVDIANEIVLVHQSEVLEKTKSCDRVNDLVICEENAITNKTNIRMHTKLTQGKASEV
jgi:hypothetical protein